MQNKIDYYRQADRANAAMRHQSTDLYQDKKSIEFKFRRKRFEHIRLLIEAALREKETVEILDLGGSEKYWLIGNDFIQANRHRLHFTIINLHIKEVWDTELFTSVVGDACDPDVLKGKTFDIVHSNSVIEHVGDMDVMRRFAETTRRLGKRYFMQTPNYWFPLEPHFRFIGYQWLPVNVRVWLMTKMSLGFFARLDKDEARFQVESIRLLTERDVRNLFPDARIVHENFMGFSKSIMAIRD